MLALKGWQAAFQRPHQSKPAYDCCCPVQSLLSTRGRRDSGQGQCLKGCRYVGTRLLQNSHGRLLSMESTQAWEAKDTWAHGPCADLLPFIFSVGAYHLLQRILVVCSRELSQFAAFDPRPVVVLGFQQQSVYKCTQSHYGTSSFKIRFIMKASGFIALFIISEGLINRNRQVQASYVFP